MTATELKIKYPHASPTFIRLNATDGGQNPAADSARVRSLHAKSNGQLSLDGQGAGEEARWYGAARRFEIRFVVYSRRPCDYDGYDIKALQDFLHKIGVIPDDGWQTLFGGTRSEKVSAEGEERTEIEIRPC
jgi:hypothetical protein